MGTTIDDVLKDANALMEHIKYWLDCAGRNNAEGQRLVQMTDELIEELLIEKERKAK